MLVTHLAAVLAATPSPDPVSPDGSPTDPLLHYVLVTGAVAAAIVAVATIAYVALRGMRRGDRLLAAEAAVNGSDNSPGLVVRVAGHDAALAALAQNVDDLRQDLSPLVAGWPEVLAASVELSPNSGSTWRDEYARDRDFIAASLFLLAGAVGANLPPQPPSSKAVKDDH